MATDFALHLALNDLSFGQVAIALLRECYKRGLHPNVFPLNRLNRPEDLWRRLSDGRVEGAIASQPEDPKFLQWLWQCIAKAQKDHSRKSTAIRLWHIDDSLHSYSATDSRLLTFHELDQLTPTEIAILRNQDRVYVTSRFSQDVFKPYGINAEYLPLGFDAHNFGTLEKRPKIEGVRQWGVGGKWEARKGHAKILNLWAKRYGNNPAHRLNLAVHNPFRRPEDVQREIQQALEGKQYWNVVFHAHMATNAEYNQFLQANDIWFALSGGEGRGLPEYHATALGAWPIALRAHAYLDYLNDDNAVMVPVSGKRAAADGVFFAPGTAFNDGNFWDFDHAGFDAACTEAEKRAATGINTKGLELQAEGYGPALDILLRDLK